MLNRVQLQMRAKRAGLGLCSRRQTPAGYVTIKIGMTGTLDIERFPYDELAESRTIAACRKLAVGISRRLAPGIRTKRLGETGSGLSLVAD